MKNILEQEKSYIPEGDWEYEEANAVYYMRTGHIKVNNDMESLMKSIDKQLESNYPKAPPSPPPPGLINYGNQTKKERLIDIILLSVMIFGLALYVIMDLMQ